jgi:hypothetical protein
MPVQLKDRHADKTQDDEDRKAGQDAFFLFRHREGHGSASHSSKARRLAFLRKVV